MFIQPGDVAGAHQVGGHADGLGPDHSDDSITEEEDDEHDHGHAHAFDEHEAALLEDELHMMEQELNGQPQEVRGSAVFQRDLQKAHGVNGDSNCSRCVGCA